MSTVGVIGALFRRFKTRYALNKYDDFSIADYFRKQGATIGRGNRILVRTLGSEPFLVEIGNHCLITSNVAFITHDGATWVFADQVPGMQKFGRIVVKDNCFIGHSVIVLPGITIGPNAIVAAGSIVTKDVAPGTVVGGNPAKVICTLEEYRIKAIETWQTQKPSGYAKELDGGKAYSPEYVEGIKRRDRALLEEHLKSIFERTCT